ncbi:helix-turn-helix domain-containing protein [Enterococcus xiangfangensis]|uniref:Helix-turn-helix transcriptional regulator n=1 Tax=Enterococcus xiangfangensis TaxID=1296537 RepID=A0ABU3FFQ9_9ENTE|nr:helix-turn-helix transcriptional regulator [Enterococcus xiangfangensis]MDT2760490.1 helix-turn-helix transcriptional regulator [Enterococcus xiangfangensis]
MIRNNLALLLTERNLKITKVANDTKISRTTLTALNQNDNKMIQMDTINTLCRYLKITPCDFFDYVPFDVDFFVDIANQSMYAPDEGVPTFKIEAFLNIDDNGGNHSFEYEGFLENYGSAPNNKHAIGVYIEPTSTDDVILYLSDLPQTFITDITQQFKNKINTAVEAFGLESYEKDFITINLLQKRKI